MYRDEKLEKAADKGYTLSMLVVGASCGVRAEVQKRISKNQERVRFQYGVAKDARAVRSAL